MANPLVISACGKGGTGKTTFIALLLKVLIDDGKASEKAILVVDADPDTNLPDVLGIDVKSTVGDAANRLKKGIDKGEFSIGISKRDLLEAWVYESLIESRDFDFLVMGRTEGEGCYCYVNSVLTRVLDTILSNYDLVLMDMEAGLEHISRRTDKDVDIMVVVTDPSRMGLKTAQRIKELVKEVHIDIKKLYLVGNRIPDSLTSFIAEWATKNNIELLGFIPEDHYISEYNMMGKPLLELPDNSPALNAVRVMAAKLNL